MSFAALLVAGCGRFGFGDAAETPDASDDAAVDAEPPRVVSAVNGLSPISAGAIDLAVIGTPSGFTATWAFDAAGMMYGVNLDPALVPVADYRVTSTRIDYVGTTLTWTGALMTTMTITPPTTFIKRYVPDLSSYVHPDTQVGIAAKPAYVTTQNRWFYAVVDTSVLHVREMAFDGTPIGLTLDVPGGGGVAPLAGSLAADPGGDLYAIWSSAAGTCEWARITTSGPLAATPATLPGDCRAPRLITTAGGVLAVVESDGAVHAVTLSATGASAPMVVMTSGTELRSKADGAGQHWLAWLDNGAVALARYTPPSTVTRVPLVGLGDGAIDGFELAERAGQVYLFAVVNGGLLAAAL